MDGAFCFIKYSNLNKNTQKYPTEGYKSAGYTPPYHGMGTYPCVYGVKILRGGHSYPHWYAIF